MVTGPRLRSTPQELGLVTPPSRPCDPDCDQTPGPHNGRGESLVQRPAHSRTCSTASAAITPCPSDYTKRNESVDPSAGVVVSDLPRDWSSFWYAWRVIGPLLGFLVTLFAQDLLRYRGQIDELSIELGVARNHLEAKKAELAMRTSDLDAARVRESNLEARIKADGLVSKFDIGWDLLHIVNLNEPDALIRIGTCPGADCYEIRFLPEIFGKRHRYKPFEVTGRGFLTKSPGGRAIHCVFAGDGETRIPEMRSRLALFQGASLRAECGRHGLQVVMIDADPMRIGIARFPRSDPGE